MDTENEQHQRYHIDNDNSSVNDSDDESNNTTLDLKERTRDNSSSDGDSEYNHDHACGHNPAAKHQSVPKSINAIPIMSGCVCVATQCLQCSLLVLIWSISGDLRCP